jgi:hypothetical protein
MSGNVELTPAERKVLRDVAGMVLYARSAVRAILALVSVLCVCCIAGVVVSSFALVRAARTTQRLQAASDKLDAIQSRLGDVQKTAEDTQTGVTIAAEKVEAQPDVNIELRPSAASSVPVLVYRVRSKSSAVPSVVEIPITPTERKH